MALPEPSTRLTVGAWEATAPRPAAPKLSVPIWAPCLLVETTLTVPLPSKVKASVRPVTVSVTESALAAVETMLTGLLYL